jgi:polar amino acid transport system substrate-binding protein
MTGSVHGRRRCPGPGRDLGLPLLAAVLALSCAPDVPADRGLERARAEGLRVGFSIEAPFAFVDSTGEARGEGPAVLRHIAGELGIDSLQWFPLEFHNLIPALRDGRIDVVASGLFITEERSRSVLFSRPKACLAPALVVHVGRDVALACDTCTIAVLRGSVEQRALRESGAASTLHPEPPSSAAGAGARAARTEQTSLRILTAPDVSTAIAAVKSRDAAALAISAPTARMIVMRDSSLMLRDTVPPALRSARGCAAFAFRPTDRSLVQAFDSVLAAFVGGAVHQSLVQRFGFTRREVSCAAAAPAAAAPAGSC